jgi:hypothetical protein
MSNVEDRLWQKVKSKPGRKLSADFTQQAMQRITKHQNASPFTRAIAAIRSIFAMRMLSKPAGIAAGVAILTITAGTGYAALRWLQPNTQVIGQVTTLENGNKRFWLHSDACQGQDMDGPVKSYYEIKASSKVTPDQIRATVESGCEDDLLEQLFPTVIAQGQKGHATDDFKPGDKQYFFPYVKLKSVGDDYLVVDGMLNGVKYPNVKLPLEKNAKMFAKGEKISVGELVPGKWLTLVTYTTALDQPYATEAMTMSQISTLSDSGFPKGAKVEGLIQRQYDVEQTMNTYANMGIEWTRLVKDDKSPDGWKQLIPLDGNWDNYNR